MSTNMFEEILLIIQRKDVGKALTTQTQIMKDQPWEKEAVEMEDELYEGYLESWTSAFTVIKHF